jgi:hypothetical protein
MIFCSSCGNQIGDRVKFCSRCGNVAPILANESAAKSAGLPAIGIAAVVATGIVVFLMAFAFINAGVQGPAAGVSSPLVVTRADYESIQTGMGYQQVRSIIGTEGVELSRSDLAGYTTVMYSWKNPNGSNMNAMFQNGRLVTKAQFGLR